MKPFTFRHGAGPWPQDVTILHVYAIPDLAVDTALSALVRQGQAAVRGLPVTPVPAEWLHVTIVMSSCQAFAQNSALACRQVRLFQELGR